MSLKALAAYAYIGSDSPKVILWRDRDAPDWVSSEQFDVVAKVDDATLKRWNSLSGLEQEHVVRPMLRRLLAERFLLKLRSTEQTVPVYAVQQAKGGAKVKEIPPPKPDHPTDEFPSDLAKNDQQGAALAGWTTCSAAKCSGHALRGGDLISALGANGHPDRKLLDETGLTGYYDVTYDIPSPNEASPLSLLATELGLRIVRKTAVVKSYSITSAQRPSMD